MRVLIVDDEPLIASSMRVFLEDEGLEAVTAGSGEEAMRILGQDPGFDICIMDMRLPGMDGNAAIRAIHRICGEMRFIVYTGSVNYNIPADMRILGISDRHLFRKPLPDMGVIVDAIRSIRGQG